MRRHVLQVVISFAASSLVLVVAADATERIPLRYEPALAVADIHSPAARLTVNGKTAWFLFDTGAGTHVLASWFAQGAGLESFDDLGGGVHGLDSTGRKLALRTVGAVSALLEDGRSLQLRPGVVLVFPPDLESAQVGGVLSPQLLAQTGDVAALDMRVPELRLEPFADAVRRLAARIVRKEQRQVCGTGDTAVPNLVFTVRVSTGSARSFLTLDTGAIATKLAGGSDLAKGRQLTTGAETWGLSGDPQTYSVSRRQKLEFAGYHARVDARVVDTPRDPCGAEGLLGLDALSRCAVVLGREDLAIRCDR